MTRNRSGFTLIEILVVVAIIAILAAVIFPVLMTAKSKANESKCSSNLRQIGMATSLYMSDNDNRYPPYKVITDDPNSERIGAWFTVVISYSKKKLLARCPADADRDIVIPPDAPDFQWADYWRNAYTNYWSGQDGIESPPPQEGIITYKKTTPYLMDGSAFAPGAPEGWLPSHHNWYGPPNSWVPARGEPHFIAAQTRHSGKANALFCDWHVKRVGMDEWKTTRQGTGASDPIKQVKGIGRLWTPKNGWENQNDGVHPWFRWD